MKQNKEKYQVQFFFFNFTFTQCQLSSCLFGPVASLSAQVTCSVLPIAYWMVGGTSLDSGKIWQL